MPTLFNYRREAVLWEKYTSNTGGEKPHSCEDHGRFFLEIFLKLTTFKNQVKTLF